MNRRRLLQGFAALALPSVGIAQSYPSKPIRYIVPVAAGGGNDMIARVVTDRWGKLLGQPFVVDNQSGGGGVIASQTTARAAPDGYTLMRGYVGTHGTTPARRRIPYDAIEQFTPVGMIGAPGDCGGGVLVPKPAIAAGPPTKPPSDTMARRSPAT